MVRLLITEEHEYAFTLKFKVLELKIRWLKKQIMLVTLFLICQKQF